LRAHHEAITGFFFLLLSSILFRHRSSSSYKSGDPRKPIHCSRPMQRELQSARQVSWQRRSRPPYYLSYTVPGPGRNVRRRRTGRGHLVGADPREGWATWVTRRGLSDAGQQPQREPRFDADLRARCRSMTMKRRSPETLWQLTNRGYLRASRAFLQVKTSTAVRAEEEDTSADFFPGAAADA